MVRVRHRVVHRQDRQSGSGAEGDPADPLRAEQPVALRGEQALNGACRAPARLARVPAGRRLLAGAEQGGGRGAQGRGQLPQRRGTWLAREVLQVRQVPRLYPRPMGHLAEAEPQLRPPRRQPPAQVARIARHRPVPGAVAAVSRTHGRAVYLVHGHHNHLDFTVCFPSSLSITAGPQEGLSGQQFGTSGPGWR